MLLARTTARRSVPSLRRGSQRRMLNNDFTVRQTGLDPKGRPYERLGGSSGRMMKGTAMTEWWDPAVRRPPTRPPAPTRPRSQRRHGRPTLSANVVPV